MAPEPDPQELKQAAFLLRLSARPVILAGAGTVGAHQELSRIAEMIDAPVITTWGGKGAISDRHPCAAGALFGQPAADTCLQEADTVLALGTSFDSGSGGQELALPAQMIQIDHNAAQIGRRFPVRLGITAGVKPALRGILEALATPNPLQGVSDRTSLEPGERTAAGRAAQLRKQALERGRSRGTQEVAALAALRSAVPEAALVLHNHEASAPWFLPFFEVAEPGTWAGRTLPDRAVGPAVAFCGPDEWAELHRQMGAAVGVRPAVGVIFGPDPGTGAATATGLKALQEALSAAFAGDGACLIASDLHWGPGPV